MEEKPVLYLHTRRKLFLFFVFPLKSVSYTVSVDGAGFFSPSTTATIEILLLKTRR